ncbi:hypothetical protein FRC04_010307 [Tulasnella sp. 424]|nr:hypothetical protein FRC04_010307 [Tulasnella sp. 424]KAG8962843.1 hypothetical protein FRC05_005091 [Tulasnella sp. 425]
MFFNILSALTLKKSTAGTTQRTGRKAKPAQPPATPIKKASAFKRVFKALKCSRSKTKESFYTPNVGYDPFSRYPTFDLDDLPGAVPFLGSSSLTTANLPLPQPSRSPIATPKTIDSGYFSAPTPQRSLRTSFDLRRDLQVKSDSMLANHDHLVEAGLQAKERRRRGPSNSPISIPLPPGTESTSLFLPEPHAP